LKECQAQIITNNSELRDKYQTLKAGDIVVGRIRVLPTEENILIDLVSRGVQLVPPALPQLVSRSKALQAQLFSQWLPPQTTPIHDIHQLMECIASWPSEYTKIITKQDRKNAGMGIHLWNNLEEVFNQASLGVLVFPFVVQPFIDAATDVRVVIIGDYLEAYQRQSTASFRNNMHFGGTASPYILTELQQKICQDVMVRGEFPYAHIDLLVDGRGCSYFLEINLRGGIRGAQIDARQYAQKIEQANRKMVDSLQG